MVSVPTEVQTENLINTSVQHYCYTNHFGWWSEKRNAAKEIFFLKRHFLKLNNNFIIKLQHILLWGKTHKTYFTLITVFPMNTIISDVKIMKMVQTAIIWTKWKQSVALYKVLEYQCLQMYTWFFWWTFSTVHKEINSSSASGGKD
jgi:hypothetical protein